MLCTCCDTYLSFTNKWKFYFFVYPKCGFCRAYVQYCMDVISFSDKIFMGLIDVTAYIEITSRMFTCISFSRHSEGHAIIYSSWNIDSLLYFFLYSPFSVTFFTGVIDFYSFSTTIVTSNCLLHDAKYAPRCSRNMS